MKMIAQILSGRTMIGAQDERLGVADHTARPPKHTVFGVIGFGLVVMIRQGGAIAEDGAAFCNADLGKPFHSGLLYVLRGFRFHLEIPGMVGLIQRQRHKTLRLFCAPATPWTPEAVRPPLFLQEIPAWFFAAKPLLELIQR